MKALIQRVSQASVTVDDQCVGQIKQGLLVLLAVEQGDEQQDVDKLVHKICNYRIFNDQVGKMNLSLQQIEGQLLVVSQFTLAADTKKGLRPGFSKSAAPDLAKDLYEKFIAGCQALELKVESGVFAADMQVALVNDGPVTFWLQSR